MKELDRAMIAFLFLFTLLSSMYIAFDEDNKQKQAICKIVDLENLNEEFIDYCE